MHDNHSTVWIAWYLNQCLSHLMSHHKVCRATPSYSDCLQSDEHNCSGSSPVSLLPPPTKPTTCRVTSTTTAALHRYLSCLHQQNQLPAEWRAQLQRLFTGPSLASTKKPNTLTKWNVTISCKISRTHIVIVKCPFLPTYCNYWFHLLQIVSQLNKNYIIMNRKGAMHLHILFSYWDCRSVVNCTTVDGTGETINCAVQKQNARIPRLNRNSRLPVCCQGMRGDDNTASTYDVVPRKSRTNKIDRLFPKERDKGRPALSRWMLSHRRTPICPMPLPRRPHRLPSHRLSDCHQYVGCKCWSTRFFARKHKRTHVMMTYREYKATTTRLDLHVKTRHGFPLHSYKLEAIISSTKVNFSKWRTATDVYLYLFMTLKSI